MENITKQQQYGKYFDDREQLTSVIEVTKQGLKRTYKSRSGASAKDRPHRLYVGIGKKKYYITSELTAQQEKKVRDYNSKLAYYVQATKQGIKGLKRPQAPKFSNEQPRYVKAKLPYKSQDQWNRLRDKFENIAINNFNCSGNYAPFEYYITLTQRDKRIRSQEIADAQYNAILKAFKRWIGSKRNKDGSQFKYTMVTVKEYGKQGFHYHLLLKVHISYDELYQWLDNHWKHGNVQMEGIKDALGLARYIFGTSSNNLGIDVTDMENVERHLKDLEQQETDFRRLRDIAHDKGLKELEQSYEKARKDTKQDLKGLRRVKTKRDDKIVRTSGHVNKTIKMVCDDDNLWQFIRSTSEYIYSERVIISDVSEHNGSTYILNEIFSDYYRQSKEDGLHLYNLCKWLIRQNKAIVK